MTQLPSKWPDHYDYLFKCDCADSHYLEVIWDDQDPDWRWLSVCEVYWPHLIRDRLKAAWRVLRAKPHYHSGIVLDNENSDRLYNVLKKHCEWTPNVIQVSIKADGISD